jgi:hypothetical protein
MNWTYTDVDEGFSIAPTSLWKQPITSPQAVISWLIVAGVFVGWLLFLGGPSYVDLGESLYATLAISHGHFGCLFSEVYTHVPLVIPNPPTLAPIYPLFAGLAEMGLRVGHAVPYPDGATASTHCSLVYDAAYRWATRAGAVTPTRFISFVSWVPLAAGVVTTLRTSNWGRRLAEPATLLIVAILPQVTACLTYVFHPEYLFALGFVLLSVAAARRGRWELSGVLMGVAFLSQQFALLVGVMLLVIAVGRARWRYALAGSVTVLLVTVPLAIATSGRAFRAVMFGTSRVTFLTPSFVHSKGGTVLWELHLHGAPLFLLTRLLPLAVVMVVVQRVHRRLGARIMEPVNIMSLVALAFSIRLVFEQNIFGYYFMAVIVALFLHDVLQGRLRVRLMIWILMNTLAFNAVPSSFASRWEPWGSYAFNAIAVFTALLLLGVVCRDLLQHRVRVDMVLILVFTLIVFRTQLFSASSSHVTLSDWAWQIILVPTGIALALQPLLVEMAGRRVAAGQLPPESVSAR